MDELINPVPTMERLVRWWTRDRTWPGWLAPKGS